MATLHVPRPVEGPDKWESPAHRAKFLAACQPGAKLGEPIGLRDTALAARVQAMAGKPGVAEQPAAVVFSEPSETPILDALADLGNAIVKRRRRAPGPRFRG